MTLGLVGKKNGMSREFLDSGISVPVTVVKIEKGRIIDIYSKEKKKYVGTAYEVGCFSLGITKLVHMVYGGFCATNSDVIAKKLFRASMKLIFFPSDENEPRPKSCQPKTFF